MIDTLGDRSSLLKAFEDPNRRLELRFRPNDIFSKPTCSERTNTTSLLLKVTKVRKKPKACNCECLNQHFTKKTSKNDSDQHFKKSGNVDSSSKLQTQVLGIVKTTFSFPNMSDFQYLPTERVSENTEVPHEECKESNLQHNSDNGTID